MLKFIVLIIFATLPATGAAAGVWEVIGEMPVAVKGGQAVVHDTLIYIVGGYTDNTYSPVNIIQVFNPRSNSWQVDADTLMRPRYGLCANRYRHSMVMMGGVSSDTDYDSVNVDSSLLMWDYTNPLYLYDYDRNLSRKFATSQVYGNSIFLFGGLMLTGGDTWSAMPYIYEYIITASQSGFQSFAGYGSPTWEGLQMPVQQMSALIDKSIYLLGGAFNGVQNSIERFDALSYEWKKLTTVLTEERAAGAAVALGSDAIALIGGYNESSAALSSVEIINLQDTSQLVSFNEAPLNYGRSEIMAAAYNGLVYVFGGVNAQGQCVPQVEAAWLERTNTLVDEDPEFMAPDAFDLLGNYPNPFNGATIIRIKNHRTAKIMADIYDVAGRRVRALASAQFPAGDVHLRWDGADDYGRDLPSGLYILRVRSQSDSQAQRLMLLR